MGDLWDHKWDYVRDGLTAIADAVAGLVVLVAGLVIVLGIPVGLVILMLALGGTDGAAKDGTFPGGADGTFVPEFEWYDR